MSRSSKKGPFIDVKLQEKIEALEAVGASVAKLPTDIAQLVKERLG